MGCIGKFSFKSLHSGINASDKHNTQKKIFMSIYFIYQ
jgi:hypothetical protein